MSIDWDIGPQINGNFGREPSLRRLIAFYYEGREMTDVFDLVDRYIKQYEAQIAKPASEPAKTLRDEFAMAALPVLIDKWIETNPYEAIVATAFQISDECMKARES